MAVFPTASSFTTSPTYSGGFIPQLWSNKLNAKFYANTMLSEVSNTDWEGEIKTKVILSVSVQHRRLLLTTTLALVQY